MKYNFEVNNGKVVLPRSSQSIGVVTYTPDSCLSSVPGPVGAFL